MRFDVMDSVRLFMISTRTSSLVLRFERFALGNPSLRVIEFPDFVAGGRDASLLKFEARSFPERIWLRVDTPC